MLFPKLQASPDFVPVAVEVVAQVSPNAPEPACDAVICMWCPTCRWLLFTTTTASSWTIQLTQRLLNGPSFSFCKTTSRKPFLVVTHWYLTSFGDSNFISSLSWLSTLMPGRSGACSSESPRLLRPNVATPSSPERKKGRNPSQVELSFFNWWTSKICLETA